MKKNTQKQFDEFRDAWVNLFSEIAKKLKLYEICDWLESKIEDLK